MNALKPNTDWWPDGERPDAELWAARRDYWLELIQWAAMIDEAQAKWDRKVAEWRRQRDERRKAEAARERVRQRMTAKGFRVVR
jgi:hypothetical protein